MIVHVGNYDRSALDGVSTTVVGQCDALLKLGANVEIWSFRAGIHDIQREIGASGIRIYLIPRFGNPLLAAMLLPKAAREWIHRRLPEISLFHLHSVFSPQNNRVANLGTPYVVTPNGGWGEKVVRGRRAFFKALWIWSFEQQFWSRARFIQAVSMTEAASLRSLPKIAEVIYIPNGVTIPEQRVQEEFSGGEKHWMFLGRLAIEQKGLDTLLKAYAQLQKTLPGSPRLLLAGPDFRGGLSELRSLAEQLGISSKVDFTGPLLGAAKEEAWMKASIFLHPSRWEGLPLSILEALAHAVPPVVTAETGFAEWVEDNACGWAVGNDPQDLADKLLDLSLFPDQISECSSNAVPAVRRDYSWGGIGTKLLDQYKQIAGKDLCGAKIQL